MITHESPDLVGAFADLYGDISKIRFVDAPLRYSLNSHDNRTGR